MSNTQLTSDPVSGVFTPPAYDHPHVFRQIEEILDDVDQVVSRVWPLRDYVAINPYSGIASRTFSDARAFLQVFSDCELLMPISYYRSQHGKGRFTIQDVRQSIIECEQAGLSVDLSADKIMETLRQTSGDEAIGVAADQTNGRRPIRSIAEIAEDLSDRGWNEIIVDELSKFCSAHYDEIQSSWQSPWKELSFYQAWRSAAAVDRNPEILGIGGFRHFVEELPHTPSAAIVELLSRLQIPTQLWESFLLCQVFSMPGWCAWAKYQDQDDESHDGEHLVGLLAARLAYDVALADATGVAVKWDAMLDDESATFWPPSGSDENDTVVRMVLQRATEIAFRNGILGQLADKKPTTQTRKLAQLVFCIDVRSERIRRNLESHSAEIETFGFAGFFGMPIEYVSLGEHVGQSNVPALIKPSFQLHEGLSGGESNEEEELAATRKADSTWHKLWQGFQKSAFGCFSFVETTGLLYTSKLFSQTNVRAEAANQEVPASKLGPTLRGLNRQGWTTSAQADLAESMLENLGLTDGFARLVVLCGHASQTVNNPLAGGLDCGACGGHSGEPNARFAALLLNQPFIRECLAERGIEIPEDTHFLAGLHNTTTDQISFFDLDSVPASHHGDVQELMVHTRAATVKTLKERAPIVGGPTTSDLLRRAADWSEVRPEWGLAGNAAFVVGPRWMTKDMNLDGRAFMHSYDHTSDKDGIVLENIMTAPMIVTHWINMQYYASSVDNRHFGSGDKTIHNVVGGFGVLSGNAGDLMTGLPIQSLHDGNDFQHQPMRLQVVIAAPRESIDRIIEKHTSIKELLDNDWLNLIAIDNGSFYRYTQEAWHDIEQEQPAKCSLA